MSLPTRKMDAIRQLVSRLTQFIHHPEIVNALGNSSPVDFVTVNELIEHDRNYEELYRYVYGLLVVIRGTISMHPYLSNENKRFLISRVDIFIRQLDEINRS
jgi:hypothetical protein